jgi:hypothetical protein
MFGAANYTVENGKWKFGTYRADEAQTSWVKRQELFREEAKESGDTGHSGVGAGVAHHDASRFIFGLSKTLLLIYLTRSQMNKVSTTGLLSSAVSIFRVIRSGP